MTIKVLEGGTYRMLSKDKRVHSIEPGKDGNTVIVVLNREWVGPTDRQGCEFDNWEAARNWVRKARQVQDA